MVNKPRVSFWKRRVPCTIFSWSMVLLLVTVALVAALLNLVCIMTFNLCLVFIMTTLICWLIPDIPKSVKLQIRHENHIISGMIIEHKLRRGKYLGIVGSRETSRIWNIVPF
ncbi:uncharacterized protein LOC143252233 isoform X3 [Tachypleus tridentatus]|uniref:uncharacterized protein LOC143252233 isoform X3 n=1 Tax=Tachypleus tridentatus TaxID=6853 RepID=UPI003FD439B0